MLNKILIINFFFVCVFVSLWGGGFFSCGDEIAAYMKGSKWKARLLPWLALILNSRCSSPPRFALIVNSQCSSLPRFALIINS